jgi:hypothetical protein
MPVSAVSAVSAVTVTRTAVPRAATTSRTAPAHRSRLALLLAGDLVRTGRVAPAVGVRDVGVRDVGVRDVGVRDHASDPRMEAAVVRVVRAPVSGPKTEAPVVMPERVASPRTEAAVVVPERVASHRTEAAVVVMPERVTSHRAEAPVMVVREHVARPEAAMIEAVCKPASGQRPEKAGRGAMVVMVAEEPCQQADGSAEHRGGHLARDVVTVVVVVVTRNRVGHIPEPARGEPDPDIPVGAQRVGGFELAPPRPVADELVGDVGERLAGGDQVLARGGVDAAHVERLAGEARHLAQHALGVRLE